MEGPHEPAEARAARLARGIETLRKKLNHYCAKNHALTASNIQLAREVQRLRVRLATAEQRNHELNVRLQGLKAFRHGLEKVSGHPTERVAEWKGMPDYLSDGFDWEG